MGVVRWCCVGLLRRSGNVGLALGSKASGTSRFVYTDCPPWLEARDEDAGSTASMQSVRGCRADRTSSVSIVVVFVGEGDRGGSEGLKQHQGAHLHVTVSTPLTNIQHLDNHLTRR